MPYKPREIESTLQRKFGFSPAEEHASDHKWYELCLPDLPPILTKVSHNRKEVGRELAGKIAKQLRVRAGFFREMMDCTRSRDDYYSQVSEDPYPPWEHPAPGLT